MKNSPLSSKKVHLKGLNGLRAIAAIGVIIFHTTKHISDFGLHPLNIFGYQLKTFLLGPYGVTMFFALSGFLITYLILKEKEISRLNIKSFYVRRILRIWPLYYLYFAITLAFTLCYSFIVPKSSIPFYLFFAANIAYVLHKGMPLLYHFWSLGAEEQFYLFFPHIAKFPNKKLLKIALLLIFLLLLLRAIAWATNLTIVNRILDTTRFQTMLTGCVAAIFYYKKKKWFFRLSTHIISQIMAWGCIVSLITNTFNVPIFNQETIAIATVFLIMGQITQRNRLINLENNICDFLGKISYGMYVIHPFLLFIFSYTLKNHLIFNNNSLNCLIVYLLMILSTVFIAYMSYELYEKRFLKLKLKYSTVKSSSTK